MGGLQAAPVQCTQPGLELAQLEGLGQVTVGPHAGGALLVGGYAEGSLSEGEIGLLGELLVEAAREVAGSAAVPIENAAAADSAPTTAFGGIIGLVAGSARRPSVRDASADVAGVFTDGRDGFADLAKRAVARRRR